jgi:hypothetical protein
MEYIQLIQNKFKNNVTVILDHKCLVLSQPQLTQEQQMAADTLSEGEWLSPYNFDDICDKQWWNSFDLPHGYSLELRGWYIDYVLRAPDSNYAFMTWLKTRHNVIDNCLYYADLGC